MSVESGLLRQPLVMPLFSMVAFSVIWGCQSPPPPPPKTAQAQISGTATIDGKAIPANCDVVFSHKTEGVTLATKSDASGRFTLTAMDPRIGIPAGTYAVAIRPPSAPTADLRPGTPEYEAFMKKDKSADAASSDAATAIPAKYQQHDTSGLVVEAKAGPNEFKLELSN